MVDLRCPYTWGLWTGVWVSPEPCRETADMSGCVLKLTLKPACFFSVLRLHTCVFLLQSQDHFLNHHQTDGPKNLTVSQVFGTIATWSYVTAWKKKTFAHAQYRSGRLSRAIWFYSCTVRIMESWWVTFIVNNNKKNSHYFTHVKRLCLLLQSQDIL